MRVLNVVTKFGDDGLVQGSWGLPPEAVERLRAYVHMTADGWIMHEWPITAEIAAVVQPWVGEPINVGSATWYLGAEQTSE